MGKNERTPRPGDGRKPRKQQNALNPDYHIPGAENNNENTSRKKGFPWVGAALVILALCAGIFIGRGEWPVKTETEQNVQASQEATEKLTVVPVTLEVWSPQADQENGSSWLCRMERKFEELHPEYDITWVNEVCNEGDAATMVTADPAAAADVYMFANDQLGTLVQYGALEKLGGSYLEQVRSDVSDTYVDTVTAVDGGVYGFPISPNTWFMYYNKSILSETDVKSMEACLAKGVVSFPVTNSWYLPSFFFAAGGTLFGDSGNDAAAGANFGGEVGINATTAILDIMSHYNFKVDDYGMYGRSGLANGTVAAYFSGSWDYKELYKALGENLGAVPAPTVMVNGAPAQLKAYAGSRAVGVNPNSENIKAAMQFAALLASADSQLLRFELRGITPAASVLMDAPLVSASIVASAEMATMEYASVVQPTIPEMASVWALMQAYGEDLLYGGITKTNAAEMVSQLYRQLNG